MTTEKRPPSGAQKLIDIAKDIPLTMFRDQYGNTWSRTPDRRVMTCTGAGIGAYLGRLYTEKTGSPPPKGATSEAAETLKSNAQFSEGFEPVYLRFGPLAGVYTPPFPLPFDPFAEGASAPPVQYTETPPGVAIDLGTDDYTAIVIRPHGWAIAPHPINFRRSGSMHALPEPSKWGFPDKRTLAAAMQTVLNLGDEDTARMVVAFLVSALKPSGPSLGLALSGPAGSAKSFGARIIRRVLDPVSLDGGGGVKSLPRAEGDFASIVSNNAIPAFDNLSGVNAEQADWIAQTMTGYSKQARELYTDQGTVENSAKRPVILTGIEITDRSDVLSRVLPIEMTALMSAATEESLWRTFDELHPMILGALCDVVQDALGNVGYVRETGYKVRMADVVRFVTAGEETLGWEPGWFEDNLADLQGSAVSVALSQQGWYQPLLDALAVHGGSLEMTPTDLLDELRDRYAHSHGQDQPNRADYTWPKNGRAMTGALARNDAALRSVGITYKSRRGHGGVRLLDVRLAAVPAEPEAVSA